MPNILFGKRIPFSSAMKSKGSIPLDELSRLMAEKELDTRFVHTGEDRHSISRSISSILPEESQHKVESIVDNITSNGPFFTHKNSIGSDTSIISGGGSDNHNILAHEIGHAMDYKDNPDLKRFARRLHASSHRTPMALTGSLLAPALYIASKGKYSKFAPLAPLAMSAPTLVQEFKANSLGKDIVTDSLGEYAGEQFEREVGRTSRLSYLKGAAIPALGLAALALKMRLTKKATMEKHGTPMEYCITKERLLDTVAKKNA